MERHMDSKVIAEIEREIGYEFNCKEVLEQAFTRKSYTDEQRGGLNNEILEFYGDRVLDLIVVKELSEYYGGTDDNGYSCTYDEADFSTIKKNLVNSKALASHIDDLGFVRYLIMSKGDIRNNAQESTHVKEDLFEAIIGAVAVDSEWNLDKLETTVEFMLHIDSFMGCDMEDFEDYVSLVQQWHQRNYGTLPRYEFRERKRVIYSIFTVVNPSKTVDYGPAEPDMDIICDLELEGWKFVGYGYSKSEARMDAAESAYNYLEENDMLFSIADEVGEVTVETAVSQLHELAQKGYIEEPEYDFREQHDKDGNPRWSCVCMVSGYKHSYKAVGRASKRDAKRGAAYRMLMSIVENRNERTDDDEDE